MRLVQTLSSSTRLPKDLSARSPLRVGHQNGQIVKIVPLAKAKAKLSGLINDVTRRDERVTITKPGGQRLYS